MDITRELRTAATTGKIVLGEREAKRALNAGKAKLIIVAKNYPLSMRKWIKNEKLIYQFESSNVDLGAACGKLFSVSILTVIEPGESNILSLIH